MSECPTCGLIMAYPLGNRWSKKHTNKCKDATPEQRAHFKRLGHWPAKRRRRRAKHGDQISV